MSHKAGRLFQCTVRFVTSALNASYVYFPVSMSTVGTQPLSWNTYTSGDIGNPGDTIESGQDQSRTFDYMGQIIAPFRCRLTALAFELSCDPYAVDAYLRFGCMSSAKRSSPSDGSSAAIWITQGRIETSAAPDTDNRVFKSSSALNPDRYEGPPAGQYIGAGDTVGFVAESFVAKPQLTYGIITALFRGE